MLLKGENYFCWLLITDINKNGTIFEILVKCVASYVASSTLKVEGKQNLFDFKLLTSLGGSLDILSAKKMNGKVGSGMLLDHHHSQFTSMMTVTINYDGMS